MSAHYEQSIIPNMYPFAFVQAVWDYILFADLSKWDDSPALDEDCCGYQAYGWDIKGQRWKRLGRVTDLAEQARATALAYHEKMVAQLGPLTFTSPLYDVPATEPAEGA